MFSASSEARDRNAPTNANQIRLQTSRIGQEHRPIRYQLPARLSFRQGHPENVASIDCPNAWLPVSHAQPTTQGQFAALELQVTSRHTALQDIVARSAT